MGNFEFFTLTRMIFGKNTYQRVGKIVKEYGFKEVLVHFGGASARKSGLLDTVTGALGAEGVQYVMLGGVQINPTLAKAKEEIELYLRKDVDLMLTVGGGGVVGSARCVANGTGNPDADVQTYFRQEVMPTRALPVSVILTLSVPGNEMSTSRVITDEENGFKRGFNGVAHHPPFSICNPELACTVSEYQIACGTMDIMVHALERYLSKTRSTELTDRAAEVLLKSMVKADRIADKEPGNCKARAVLMREGSLSHSELVGTGRNFFMQVHQLEHELSDVHLSITHGAGLAALWSLWTRFARPGDMNRFARYAVRVWNIDMDLDCPTNTALAGIWATEDFYKSLSMPFSLKEFGAEGERLEEMAEKCTNTGKRTLPGIWELGKEEMMEIYRMAMGK